jgi:hypothetical protein
MEVMITETLEPFSSSLKEKSLKAQGSDASREFSIPNALDRKSVK